MAAEVVRKGKLSVIESDEAIVEIGFARPSYQSNDPKSERSLSICLYIIRRDEHIH